LSAGHQTGLAQAWTTPDSAAVRGRFYRSD